MKLDPKQGVGLNDATSLAYDGVAICDDEGRLVGIADDRVLAQQIVEMDHWKYMPHVWFCPSCAYELVKRTGQNQTIPNPVYSDKCPNDGTTLERMTWKRKAEQLLQTVPDANCMVLINELRKEEGSSVEILCDNSEGPCAIEVTGEWTSWSARRFEGVNVLEALQTALNVRSLLYKAKEEIKEATKGFVGGSQ